jgi:predicted ATP-grasp superfamily ATP-dependent carboligase
MRPRVLLLGKYGPPFLAFARSLHAHGWDSYILEARDGPWRQRSARLGGGATIPPSLIGTPAGIERVRDYGREIGARALVTLSETHLLWIARERAAFTALDVLVPPLDVLERVQSKRWQIELAKKVGFPMLSTTYLQSAADAAGIAADDYPLALRPSNDAAATPLFKVLLAHSREELEAQLAGVRISGEGVIAQPFRHLPNLVVHAARSADGRILAQEGFLVPRKFEGVTLSIERFPLSAEVDAQCRAFADEAGLVGNYHYELLWDDRVGKAYYLEVNVRLGGTTEKVLRRGFDEPGLLMASFGMPVGPPSVHSDDRSPVANKRVLVKHIWYALRGRTTELDYPAVSRGAQIAASVRQLLTASDSVFDWSDLRGSIDFHFRKP